MQWSNDRNAGFSTADPARLYLPVITDPVYGYQAVNVAAQEAHDFSLLNVMKRLIAARRTALAFGRGTIEFLRPRNQSVLAYYREHEGETMLVVANLSATTQPVDLDLSRHEGAQPVEILSGARFPVVGRAPYFLSLGPLGYYWLRLERRERRPVRYGIESAAI
jgi:maltose alpha-D-glucosyltransferase/alpha-amylase